MVDVHVSWHVSLMYVFHVSWFMYMFHAHTTLSDSTSLSLSWLGSTLSSPIKLEVLLAQGLDIVNKFLIHTHTTHGIIAGNSPMF